MTDSRDLSKKSPYAIEHHRYLELRHFCFQYKIWKQLCKDIDGFPSVKFSSEGFSKNISNPVLNTVERREEYLLKMELIENTAKLADSDLAEYLIHGVTEGTSYYGLRLYYGMPACKEKYYNAYRRFFFILDISRK